MNQHKPQAGRKKTRETFDVLECITHSESMVVIRPYGLRPFYFIINRQMKIEEIKIEKLIPYEFNNKIHGENQINRIANSIKEFGFLQPIVIDKQNIVIVGHGRLEGAKKLGLETVPCVRVENLTEQQIKKYRILDNRLNESERDVENLQIELSTLPDLNIGDLEINIDDEFGDLFTEEESEEKELEEDEAPAVSKKAKAVEYGDIFQLGKHRLMCGDSTKIENIEELMNGEKADLIFTDPPYGINVVGKGGNIGGSTNRNGKKVEAKKYMSIIGDNEDYDPSFIIQTFPGSKIILRGANYYANRLENSGKRLVRDKNRGEGTTFSDCELCRTNLEGIAVKKYKCTRDGMRREGESESRIHPTQKPLKLCGDIIQDYSEKGQNVVDLFGGRGSTLIACEQIGRNCLMIELDPRYIEAIIKRFHNLNPDAEIKCVNREININEILSDEK